MCVCVCVCVCVCLPKLHLVAIMQSGVWEPGDGERKGGGQSCGKPKSFPFSHPFDVLPLRCNRLMSLRRRPSEKEESFIKMSSHRTFINLAFPCTFLAHVHIARLALHHGLIPGGGRITWIINHLIFQQIRCSQGEYGTLTLLKKKQIKPLVLLGQLGFFLRSKTISVSSGSID